MKNYYEEIIAEIHQHLVENNVIEAKKLLEDELSAPYIPEPQYSEFKRLYEQIPKEEYRGSLYFQEIDEIIMALKSDELLQIKALKSLERANLKMWQAELEELLFAQEIDDWIKKQLLVLLLEQGFNGKVIVNLSKEDHEINLSSLIHPFKTKAYNACFKELEARYGMDNPSFLELCLMELNYKVSMAFPFKHEDINVDDIINQVNIYLNAK